MDEVVVLVLSIKYNAETYQIDVNNNSTTTELKQKIQELLHIPIGLQRLVFHGRLLRDDEVLNDTYSNFRVAAMFVFFQTGLFL